MEISDTTAVICSNRALRWLLVALLTCVVALESGCAGSRRCGTCNATRSSFSYPRCDQCRDLIATQAWNSYDCHGFEPTVWEPWPYGCPAVVVVPAENVVTEEVVSAPSQIGDVTFANEAMVTEQETPTSDIPDSNIPVADDPSSESDLSEAITDVSEQDILEPEIEESPVATPTNEPPLPPLPAFPAFDGSMPPEPRVGNEGDLGLRDTQKPVQLVGFADTPEAAERSIQFDAPTNAQRSAGRTAKPISKQMVRRESSTEMPKVNIVWDPPFFDPTVTRERLEASTRRR